MRSQNILQCGRGGGMGFGSSQTAQAEAGADTFLVRAKERRATEPHKWRLELTISLCGGGGEWPNDTEEGKAETGVRVERAERPDDMGEAKTEKGMRMWCCLRL